MSHVEIDETSEVVVSSGSSIWITVGTTSVHVIHKGDSMKFSVYKLNLEDEDAEFSGEIVFDEMRSGSQRPSAELAPE